MVNKSKSKVSGLFIDLPILPTLQGAENNNKITKKTLPGQYFVFSSRNPDLLDKETNQSKALRLTQKIDFTKIDFTHTGKYNKN